MAIFGSKSETGLEVHTGSVKHGSPEIVEADSSEERRDPRAVTTIEEIQAKKKGPFAFFKSRNFYIVLVLGQVLSLCLVATNTFTTFLVNEGCSIPAFQTWFNYVLLNAMFTTYTIYRYGFKGYGQFLYKFWWKYIILSFCDVEGNYFTVLAYRYTTILSAELINFWAIVMVVLVSFCFLGVRYHWAQILGIFICIGGLGILIGSDHITGTNQYTVDSGDQLKGDLFALLGATFYGLANIAEEYLVSGRPLWEVVGQMGFWGMIINGVQAGIFDRASFQSATWNGAVGGYLVGYTLALTIFYCIAPIVFRMSSAAFLNISLLTSNFWGTVVGIQVFGLTIYYLYPIAFVCIVGGLTIYFIGKQVLGEAVKPWLGRNQEKGVAGLGTARRRVEHPDAIV